MKILVSNIGSTSFKFRLFLMDGPVQRELAAGAADRIGQAGGTLKLRVGSQGELAAAREFADHGSAIRGVMEQLIATGAIASAGDLDAVAFKAVMAGDCEPVVRVDEALLERMEYFVPIAPMHNPPYIAAMRMFRSILKDTPLVAVFEPGFHATNPPRRRIYAVPPAWAQRYGVKRYGYHGASHCYIAARMAEVSPAARRVISCHLGGSSSLCAIRDGKSIATSMGLSAQSGLPQGNRCGDFDPFAIALLERQANMTSAQVLDALGKGAGLAAVSGTSGDMRDIWRAARAGSEQSQLAIDLFATAIRDYLGAYLVELGGADAIVFTGGIGQKDGDLRAMVCRGLEFAGIRLDAAKNAATRDEGRIGADGSAAAIWVMPTNEELIVARQAARLLNEKVIGRRQ